MLQDVDVFAEATFLPTQLVALRALVCREFRAFTLIDPGLFPPRPHGYLGQINVPDHLADVPTADTTPLTDLCLKPRVVELRGRTFVRSRVSTLTIPSDGFAPHVGCPLDRDT